MANCPSCGRILNFWNVKAECPYCKVNIPNYNWEQRLDEDAANAEIAWKKFRIFTGNFKSALFGNKLRIIRFVCTFVPLVALVLPLASFDINLPFVSASGNFSLLNFTLDYLLNLNWGSILKITSASYVGTPVTLVLVAILLLYLAVVFGVLNFVFVLLRAPKLKAGFNMTMCMGSALCFTAAAALYMIGLSALAPSTLNVLTGSLQYGVFVGIALFILNFVLNTVVNKGFKKQRNEITD